MTSSGTAILFLRENLGEMEVKGYSAFSKTPVLMKTHTQIF